MDAVDRPSCIALLVWLVRPAALPAAAPVLVLWMASRGLLRLAEPAAAHRQPRICERQTRTGCASHAEKICRFFRDWSSPGTNWLIPDSVREDGEAALRLSPTNLGMLLNARIAAVHFGVMHAGASSSSRPGRRSTAWSALPKYRGHLLNWYDIATLEPLEPRFVSTVDSGNLAACLWTLKQAALAFAAEPQGEARDDVAKSRRS